MQKNQFEMLRFFQVATPKKCHIFRFCYNENDEVDYMIRRLFKDPKHIDPTEEEFDYDAPNMWDTQVDTLKRRLNKLKKISENKNADGRSSSIHSGCAR